MIQSINDVYDLILNPKYSMQYTPDTFANRTQILTDGTFGNRVEVSRTKTTMDIYVFQNGNTQFYEHISRRNRDYKRIHDAVFAKGMAAMVMDIDKHYR